MKLMFVCFQDRHYDEIVILPSITETAQALARTKGIAYYEHRTLFELALLLDPSIKKIIYLSALPVGEFYRHSSRSPFYMNEWLTLRVRQEDNRVLLVNLAEGQRPAFL